MHISIKSAKMICFETLFWVNNRLVVLFFSVCTSKFCRLLFDMWNSYLRISRMWNPAENPLEIRWIRLVLCAQHIIFIQNWHVKRFNFWTCWSVRWYNNSAIHDRQIERKQNSWHLDSVTRYLGVSIKARSGYRSPPPVFKTTITISFKNYK